MPTDWEPWPGKIKANGFKTSSPVKTLNPGQLEKIEQRVKPGQKRQRVALRAVPSQ
jgi:hypothetical protein